MASRAFRRPGRSSPAATDVPRCMYRVYSSKGWTFKGFVSPEKCTEESILDTAAMRSVFARTYGRVSQCGMITAKLRFSRCSASRLSTKRTSAEEVATWMWPISRNLFISRSLDARFSVPVIGIGAGPDTYGQVLFLHDMLGISLTGLTLHLSATSCRDSTVSRVPLRAVCGGNSRQAIYKLSRVCSVPPWSDYPTLGDLFER
ncbi:Ketopantoate hydroxymethyltransferase [Rosenbergiella nectarea]|uniref:3-methyl-2-oxobutanoate hydroxymethyltransferase n=2 Tax=Rosenbergiella nectarea TaxID=988801 RepID=A0A1H9G6W9_9GAMM|nr:Ketopantoate hydroxymethyltransferase [Rosenbergiella nectarea]